MKVWLNGAWADGPITLDAADRGLTLGDGVFETILVRDGEPVWYRAHVARLAASARELGIAFDAALLPALPDDHTGHGVLRVALTRGPGGRGLAAGPGPATIIATLAPFAAGLVGQPMTLATVNTRRNEGSASSRLKTLSYADNILAAREAAARGADEALMLNNAGRAACVSIGNIFAVIGGRAVTPPVSEGALPGIARARLLDLGLAGEAPLTGDDLARAEAMFMTNSLRLVRPVLAFDGRAMNSQQHPAVSAATTALSRDAGIVIPAAPF